MRKTRKMNKIEKICRFWSYAGKIGVQLITNNYGENEIRKIYDNFCFLVQFLMKIIINFSDLRILTIFVIFIFRLDTNFPSLQLKS